MELKWILYFFFWVKLIKIATIPPDRSAALNLHIIDWTYCRCTGICQIRVEIWREPDFQKKTPDSRLLEPKSGTTLLVRQQVQTIIRFIIVKKTSSQSIMVVSGDRCKVFIIVAYELKWKVYCNQHQLFAVHEYCCCALCCEVIITALIKHHKPNQRNLLSNDKTKIPYWILKQYLNSYTNTEVVADWWLTNSGF